MENGVGYMNHPYDCTQFVQCYISGKGNIQAYYRHCPFGQYWDQTDLTCRPVDDVQCPHGECAYFKNKYKSLVVPNKSITST